MKLSRVLFFSLALFSAAGASCALETVQTVPPDRKLYAVVVSRDTYDKFPDWRAVADALAKKHNAKIFLYDGSIANARDELSAWMPDTICFVARPQEAGRNFVVAVHRMTRRLDDDIYTDAPWGILTGYDAADALRIANHSEPLVITRGASGAGPSYFGHFHSGFATSEGEKGRFWKKDGDKVETLEAQPDPTELLVQGFNTMKPQIFFTSGHATERDWQVGYNVKAGQFRHRGGQLLGINTQNKVFNINSPEPKIYLAMGNCLIGHIDRPDCMATAWMHSGGVYQMYGYTVVTWFGRMGWGTKDTFLSRQYSFAEAFYWTSQGLLHDLHKKYPQFAAIEFETYDQGKIGWLAGRHKVVIKNEKTGQFDFWKEPMGLLWDRDVVAFYGDPAWEARLPAPKNTWSEKWSTKDGVTTFTVTPEKDGGGPPGGVRVFLPERLTDIEVVAGKEHNPIVTDNFLWFRPAEGYKKGVPVSVSFRGRKMVRPDAGKLKMSGEVRAALEMLPPDSRNAATEALARAGANAAPIAAAIRAVPENQREAVGFLIANMPDQDLATLGTELLVENVTYAFKAHAGAPWAREISKELFLNNILPYANLDEPRDSWRKMLYERFHEEAWKHKTPAEAAKFLNARVFPELKVQYHPTKRPRPNMSPLESIEAGFASCTGLSVLLVDACRAVGIPARVAGIPLWYGGENDPQRATRGNHTWVEVWDGKWYSLGAAEPSELNRGWFMRRAGTTNPAKPEHRIYAASFKKTGLFFPLVWNIARQSVPAEDVTQSYIDLVKKPEGEKKAESK